MVRKWFLTASLEETMLEIALYLISLIVLASLGTLTAFRLTSNPLHYRTQSSASVSSQKSTPEMNQVSQDSFAIADEINLNSFVSKESKAFIDAEKLEKCRNTIHRVNLQVLLGRYRMGMPVNGAVFPGETQRRTYSVGSADYLPNKEKLLLRQAGDFKWDEAAGKF